MPGRLILCKCLVLRQAPTVSQWIAFSLCSSIGPCGGFVSILGSTWRGMWETFV